MSDPFFQKNVETSTLYFIDFIQLSPIFLYLCGVSEKTTETIKTQARASFLAL